MSVMTYHTLCSWKLLPFPSVTLGPPSSETVVKSIPGLTRTSYVGTGEASLTGVWTFRISAQSPSHAPARVTRTGVPTGRSPSAGAASVLGSSSAAGLDMPRATREREPSGVRGAAGRRPFFASSRVLNGGAICLRPCMTAQYEFADGALCQVGQARGKTGPRRGVSEITKVLYGISVFDCRS